MSLRQGLAWLAPLLALAALLWGLDPGGAGPPLEPPAAPAPSPPPDAGPRMAPEPPREPAVAPLAGPPPDDVPRILPPEAAIEDLRDALAGTDERAEAASEAFAALRALSARGGEAARRLREQAAGLVGPRLRRAVIASLGADPTPETRAWLLGRLAYDPPGADALSALIALCVGEPGAGGATVALGPGLEVSLAAVPAAADVEAATRAFVRRADPALAREALPVLRVALGGAGRLAWLVDASGAVALVAHLDAAGRAALLAVAHADPALDAAARERLLGALR